MIAGLTGGIGSGKSTVARLLGLMGCAVFESDRAAKQAYLLPAVVTQVKSLLGEQAYLGDRKINKSFISERIFADPEMLRKINGIIHPAVKELFMSFIAEHKNRPVIKESALLFEAGITEGLDSIIVVAADDETRISRVMKRDRISREQVLAKLKSQIDQAEKISRADHVINNNNNDLLIPQVERIYIELISA